MARPIVLSNGNLHVGINRYGLVHDFYYPYVGLENHAAGKSLRHRVGVWVEGALSWLDDGSWEISFGYHHDSLIGITRAKHAALDILLELEDTVDAELDCFMRNIHVVNLSHEPRDIRLFMHQAFVIGDTRSLTDTGQYLPGSNAILHYKGQRAFVVGGAHDDTSFDQYSIGLFGIEGREGTYRDADDGELSGSSVEHGQVDSTIRFMTPLDGHSSTRVHYWIAAGESTRGALEVHKRLTDGDIIERFRATASWWQSWLAPARKLQDKIAPDYQQSFIQSVMIIKSQIDNRGAVIASTDSRMLNYSRDAYAYCWPRDGAYVIWPLIRMGYIDEPERFFAFTKSVMHPHGYVMHKYRADGALGSSWHPYIHEAGIAAPPIQEDETALVVFVFGQYYQMHRDPAVLERYYDSMIVPMANFMARYIDQATGLPRPSYDLWEEVFLTTTYTTSVVYAALLAAADLADVAKRPEDAVKWRTSADDIYTAAHAHLYNDKRRAFYKGILATDNGIIRDETLDASSVFGAFMFGLFPLNSTEFTASMATFMDAFTLHDSFGVPRYEGDNYQRQGEASNWWPICSLWMAEYYLERGDTQKAGAILGWVRSRMSSTGMLPEQLNPATDAPVSVEPLTWSHAEYVACLLDTITDPDHA